MTDQSRNGKVPTPEEFFDHCLVISDICEQSLLDAQALRDEALRVLSQVHGAYAASQSDVKVLSERIAKQGSFLRELYAPDSVNQACLAAEKTISKFESAVNGVFEDIKVKANEVSNIFWFRTFGAAAIAVIVSILIVGLIIFCVPNLDEINSRRAQISRMNHELDSLNNKIITFEGRKWVRTDAKTESICVRGNCATYARVD